MLPASRALRRGERQGLCMQRAGKVSRQLCAGNSRHKKNGCDNNNNNNKQASPARTSVVGTPTSVANKRLSEKSLPMLSLTLTLVPSLTAPFNRNIAAAPLSPPLLLRRSNKLPPRLCLPVLVECGDFVRVVADVEIGDGVSARDMVGEVVVADTEPYITVELRKPILGYFEYGELQSLKGSSGELVEGDRVKCIESVTVKGGIDALGLEGTVYSVWEQCETDPACCCNELATVPLQVNLDPPAAAAATSSSWTGQLSAEDVVVLRRAAAGE